jgi:UDP-glucose 4-epimerase
MDKVAITGGAGFIGSNLAARLNDIGYQLVIIDDLSTGLRSNVDTSRNEFHEISISDFDTLKKALYGCRAIFHLGARGSVPRSIKNPTATHLVNATGTLNILEIARMNEAHVIFSSSSSVYGRNLELPKNEDMWLGPMTPYAASKLAGESYVQAYASAYGLPTTLLRFFNVFGPRQRPDHEYAAVLPKWIWLAMKGIPIELYGDGTSSRDFTYVDTVVDVLVSSMENRITKEGAINLAFGNRVTLNHVLSLLKQNFPSLEVVQKESRLGDVKESQNSPELIRELFPEIEPKSFEDAFSNTVAWLKEHGKTVANGPATSD